VDTDQDRSQSVDDYIASFPPEIAERLNRIRQIIKDEVPPGTSEVISYKIPSYKKPEGGRAYIYFAGFARHISLYPIRPERTGFAKELKPYLSGRATLQFPHNQPLPLGLIKQAVGHLVKENTAQ
jgi:uncharacterized protein YdhG (YjbR/CyaY superfamily)